MRALRTQMPTLRLSLSAVFRPIVMEHVMREDLSFPPYWVLKKDPESEIIEGKLFNYTGRGHK